MRAGPDCNVGTVMFAAETCQTSSAKTIPSRSRWAPHKQVGFQIAGNLCVESHSCASGSSQAAQEDGDHSEDAIRQPNVQLITHLRGSKEDRQSVLLWKANNMLFHSFWKRLTVSSYQIPIPQIGWHPKPTTVRDCFLSTCMMWLYGRLSLQQCRCIMCIDS